MSFKCPGQPALVLNNPLCEELFPNIQSKPSLEQLKAISSYPLTGYYLGEETNPQLAPLSFQAVVESDKVSPEVSFIADWTTSAPSAAPHRT